MNVMFRVAGILAIVIFFMKIIDMAVPGLWGIGFVASNLPVFYGGVAGLAMSGIIRHPIAIIAATLSFALLLMSVGF